MKYLIPGGIALVLLSLIPLASVFLAEWLGSLHGCDVHEGFANPCVFWGADRGAMLASMSAAGWLMLLSIPLLPIGAAMVSTGRRHRAEARQ